MTSSELLVLEAAGARRGAFELGPLDLVVRTTDLVAIVGANGAGKSTALSLAVGDLPGTGRILLAGDPPSTLSRRDVARRASLLRQRSTPAFALSALEIVLHGRWVHLGGLRFPGPRDLDLATRSLERLAVGHLSGRLFGSLSGGEQQRVLLAKALAQESPLLLLDEPTAGLDMRHRVEVLEMVTTLARGEGRGVLLVTHDLDLAAGCDWVVALREGRCVGAGPPGVVLSQGILEATFSQPVHVDAHPDTGHARVSARFDPKRHA